MPNKNQNMLEDKKIISDLYVKYIEDVLAPSEEYKQYQNIYTNLREQLECRLDKEGKEQLEEICCSIFNQEEFMHKQSFVKGFIMAVNLILESKKDDIADIVDAM